MSKMITYENMIAVTNRRLYLQEEENSRCRNGGEDGEAEEKFLPGTCSWNQYLEQVKKVLSFSPKALVLREKDLEPEVYRQLAQEVTALCEASKTECILHGFSDEARALSWRKIHLPLSAFRKLPSLDFFEKKGTSVHSLEEAREAEALGADYLFAGNIFETDCKKGLPGRGLSFLKEVCSQVSVPVYGIGGITPERMEALLSAGAAGGCMMSGFLKLQREGEEQSPKEKIIQRFL